MDSLHRFSFTQLPVRGQWVRLQSTLVEAAQYKTYPKPVSALLGQMLATVAMVADNLKFSGAVALQSKGNGALRRSLAECRDHTNLRGIMHLTDDASFPQDDSDIGTWLGDGQLALTLLPDEETGMQPYQGLVSLEHDDLAGCLESYFARSEQLDTRMHFAHGHSDDEQSVTGLLLQRLPNAPDASENDIEAAEDAWQTLTALAATVTSEELSGLDVETLLHRLFHEYPCSLQPAKNLAYQCTCSRERTDSTLMMLGEQDLLALMQEQDEITVDCEFCGNRYHYDEKGVGEVLDLLKQQDGAGPSTPLH
jgi:molecular chaperone Hsp33